VKWLTIIAAIIGVVSVGYGLDHPSLPIRYRLTLEAEVEGTPKNGSSVIEVTYAKQLNIGSDLSVSHQGEAVALDLGPRGTLFALLKQGTDSRSIPETIIFRAFNFDGGIWPTGSVEHLQSQLRKLSGKRELPLSNLPLLVRFRDINNPMTAERVDPFEIGKSFGEGARLVRATLEIVPAGVWPLNLVGLSGEPITDGIEKRLKWLAKTKGGSLDGGVSSRNAPLELHGGDFKIGLYR
jgi:hypothetical protein